MKHLSLIALASLALFCAACGDDDGPTPPPSEDIVHYNKSSRTGYLHAIVGTSVDCGSVQTTVGMTIRETNDVMDSLALSIAPFVFDIASASGGQMTSGGTVGITEDLVIENLNWSNLTEDGYFDFEGEYTTEVMTTFGQEREQKEMSGKIVGSYQSSGLTFTITIPSMSWGSMPIPLQLTFSRRKAE